MTQVRKNPVPTGEWECMECGYIEEGVPGRRPAKCTECNAPASALEFFAYEDDDDWDSDEGEDEAEDGDSEWDGDDDKD